MSQGLFWSLYSTGLPFALIDTRERREHVNGHWFGSTNLPLSVLTESLPRLIPQKDFPVHLLDWQDGASEAAARRLDDLGYSGVTRHETSPPEQFGHGYVKGEYDWSKAFGEVVAHTCGLTEVTPAEYLAHYKDAQLFDVRPTAEYSQFTIPNSQSLPNSLLLANLTTLAASSEMALLHCAGRTRSIIGACTLKAAGYEGRYAIFKGGTQAWELDGMKREFNATRLFATESDSTGAVAEFLNKWTISLTTLTHDSLNDFVASHRDDHLFDVSNDAATGQTASHQIIKISGTNLIQQTDRSIARYHVPVVLFDTGSGSRAAFAAYWLQLMGYYVSVVLLPDPLDEATPEPYHAMVNNLYETVNVQQLLKHRDGGGKIIDCRRSDDFTSGTLRGCVWGNISELLNQTPAVEPVMVIGRSDAQTAETAQTLAQHEWQIAGTYVWNANDIGADEVTPGNITLPIDQSDLFAGRHHGNRQDSIDYLAWEEDLPEQIDQQIHSLWLDLLAG